jgi:hypothetical protein
VETLNALEDPDGALEAARLASKRFRSFPQSHLAVAQQLARLGRYQEARLAFEETLKIIPTHAEARLGLADTLQKAGEHSEALAHYRSAMESPGTTLAARLGLARSLIALKQLEEARKTLEEGVVMHPSEVSLRIELSRVYARLGKSDLANEQVEIIEQIRTARSGR